MNLLRLQAVLAVFLASSLASADAQLPSRYAVNAQVGWGLGGDSIHGGQVVTLLAMSGGISLRAVPQLVFGGELAYQLNLSAFAAPFIRFELPFFFTSVAVGLVNAPLDRSDPSWRMGSKLTSGVIIGPRSAPMRPTLSVTRHSLGYRNGEGGDTSSLTIDIGATIRF